MEALRRMQKKIKEEPEEEEPEAASPPQTQEQIAEETSQEARRNWRSYILRLTLIKRTAEHIEMVEVLERGVQMKNMKANLETYARTGVMPKDKKEKKTTTATMASGRGRPLPPGTGKHDGVAPESCPHPSNKMEARANAKSMWWTCKGCGSRWERTETAHIQRATADTVPEEEYEWILNKLPVCTGCGKPMTVRRAKKTGELFMGCTAFPECRHTTPLPEEIKKHLEPRAQPSTSAASSQPTCEVPTMVPTMDLTAEDSDDAMTPPQRAHRRRR